MRSLSSRTSRPAPPRRGSRTVADASRTRRLLDSLPAESEAGGAGGSSTWAALQRADASWSRLRGAVPPEPLPAPFVTRLSGPLSSGPPQYDVLVCGGTLGVVYAAALAVRGRRVAVVERGVLAGRAQDWNISRDELLALVREGVLSAEQAEGAITATFNPGRCAFHGHSERAVAVQDVLNLGVSPAAVIAGARGALEAAGGVVFERTAGDSLSVYDDGAALCVPGAPPITARLVIDCMGHASPMVLQARHGRRPDGVCLVVGSCARGFPPEANTCADVIATVSDLDREASGLAQQLFWEAFPAGSGPGDRTSYMFTYIDADAARLSLGDMLERYWELMPAYQGVALEQLQLQRVLFGAFPTYRDSPLSYPWGRCLPVGDASGVQSPLSFGGFGALTRHLGRMTRGVDEALAADCVSASELALLNPYLPNLSGAWLFARAMSAPRGTNPSPGFVNELLATNFGVMQRLGTPVLRPFLQDVPQFKGLSLTLGAMMAANPALIPAILWHCGPLQIAAWARHYGALGAYTLLSQLLENTRGAPLPPRLRYRWRRALDAWRYGSGLDYGE